jgi:glycosyltransferase involved in cell wall biosynthesis
MAVVEAMSAGVPCVVSNRASLPEIVQDGVCGFLADPSDPKDFANKIKKILDDSELKARMSESAKSIAKKYSWRSTAHGQLEILKKFLGRQT